MDASTKTMPAGEAADIREALNTLCGGDNLTADSDELRFFSQDLFFEGAIPLAVVSPTDTQMVADLVTLCRKHGVALHPRGGGMSYTDAFQPVNARAVVIDLQKMNAIREISVGGGYITAEAGCTWSAIDDALAKHGMRARFWGPMSGAKATLGGSLSQGSVTFGSGNTGASANAVKSFEIVAGTGEILRTGSDGMAGASPFNRNYGPDMTGIFANDAGALGIKTAASLEIEPRPAKVSGLSFAFDDFNAMAGMFHEVTLRRLSSEMIAMDAKVAQQNAGTPDLVEDAKAMWRVGKSAGNPVAGLGRMARVALGGRGFLDKAHYTAHFVIEGRDRADLASRMKAVRGFAKGGDEIVNTVPLMTRASPFPELPVTHPDGRRMLPIHGIFPTMALGAFHRDYLSLKACQRRAMEAADVTIAEFFASIAGIGLLYEPVFYWPDARFAYHDRMTPDHLAGGLQDYPENIAARDLVNEMTGAIVQLMRKHGSGHFQIGRLYPCMEEREESSGKFLRAIKRELDPDGIINPGALGL